jgi:hypothetical protein
LKLTGKFLIGYKNKDENSKNLVHFLKVLSLHKLELFGDAYYELNFRRNSTLRKPLQLPKDDDVKLVYDEYKLIISSVDVFDVSSSSLIPIRAAVSTYT